MKTFFLAVSALFLFSCGPGPKLAPVPPGGVVLAFGDSITFGTGAAPEHSYPAVLEGLIGRRVVNAGVPGETTAEGLARLPAVLEEQRPALMILCLGGNDFLRRQNDREVEKNLRQMVQAARERGVEVVLLAVPKLGFTFDPAPLYGMLANELSIPLEGKVLSKVLAKRSLKSDPIHPNVAGYRRIAESVAELLRKRGAV